jgi:2-methylcitrate dehydratase PrpD
LRERGKINLVRDEALAKLLPVRVAVIEIEFADGARLSERVSAVRGTPRNPMSREEVVDKARDLIVPVIGRDASERLIQTVLAIEAVPNISELRPTLQRVDQ